MTDIENRVVDEVEKVVKGKRMRSGWKRNAKKPEMSMILTIRRL